MRRTTTTIGVLRYTTGLTDRKGNPIKGYSDPVQVPVYGIAPSTRTEPGDESRPNAISSVWEVYAPAGTQVGPYDRVQLPTGELCEVIGEIGVWGGNPDLPVTNQSGVHFVVQRHKG